MGETASFDRASRRFRSFFEELDERFVERSDVLRQVALALLSREHVLISGPPGTAKSQLATSVFGRIVCEDTGSPSVFSRQITESTIQTDLIGPIDFKNLMETGRTAHFTDEGILGAAHAFLDEIFDGRDMLLRSALNVLHERELKQGTTVTRGRVECALMTSNRYIAEVVSSSHGNLLAFVDRIAFLAFVPRGFASPANTSLLLRRVIGGAAPPPLDALLTLQDLDVLQAETDGVWIDDAMCDAVADLVARLDLELAQAVRADPEFHPTRYLSVRTAVRCGRILRAAVVHDALTRRPDRPREVLPEDLPALRHYLVLNGPTPTEVDTLLAREVDPSERRQLGILKTERQIVDRCIAQVVAAAKAPAPRPPPAAKVSPAIATSGSSPVVAAAPSPIAATLAAATARAGDAEARGDVEALLAVVRELAPLARGGDGDAQAAARAVASVTSGLARTAARRGLDASAGDASPLAAVEGLATVVGTLADDSVSLHGVVQGLAVQALELLDRLLAFPLTPTAADLQGAMLATEVRIDARIEVLRRARALFELLSARAGRDAGATSRWVEALSRAEDEIAALQRAPFAEAVQRGVRSDPAAIGELCDALAPELDRLIGVEQQLADLGLPTPRLRTKVAQGDLRPLVGRAFGAADAASREAVVGAAVRLEETLRTRGLGAAITTADWLGWAAEAVARRVPQLPEGASREGLDGYRALRAAEERSPVSLVLADLALRIAPELRSEEAARGVDPAAVRAVVAQLPEETRARAAAADLARIDRAIGYLERWWEGLGRAATGEGALRELVTSGIYQVVWDESALARFALEAELVSSILPDAAPRAAELVRRTGALDRTTHERALELLSARGDAAWASARGASA